MNAIINRKQEFGTLNGVITKNEEIRKVINQCLIQGTAKLLIDTEEILMYKLPVIPKESMPNISLHKCKYCGAMTEQPDEDCYKAPHHVMQFDPAR